MIQPKKSASVGRVERKLLTIIGNFLGAGIMLDALYTFSHSVFTITHQIGVFVPS